MGLVKFKKGTKEKWEALQVKNPETLYFIEMDSAKKEYALYLGENLVADGQKLNKAVTDLESLKTLIGTLPEDAGVQTIVEYIDKKLGEAGQGKLNNVTAADNSIEIGGTETDKTVKVKISQGEGNVLSLAEDGLKVAVPEAKDYTVTVTTPDEASVAKRYTIQQASTGLNVNIDIPKDMVVSSGEVATYTEENKPEGVVSAGTYLVLTLANATSDKVYINVGDLIEYVTSGSQEGDAIQIAIDAQHKVTASIKDASIEKTKLAQDVQTSLGKADSAIQAIQEGNTNGTINVDGTDVKVKGLAALAYKETVAEADLEEGLKTKIEGKADKATTLAGYGITDAYTKTEVDGLLTWGNFDEGQE